MALLGSLCRLCGHSVAGLRAEAPLGCRSMGAAPNQDHPQCQQDICVLVGFSSALCKEGLHSLASSLSKTSTGFPRARASGCPPEVVRDHTRDKLGKDEGEIPHPLYLFVSLSAILTCVVVYKVLHNSWSCWLGSLGDFGSLEQW